MQGIKAKAPLRDDEFWESVEKMARQADSWPQWMKGGEGRKAEAVSDTPQLPVREVKDDEGQH